MRPIISAGLAVAFVSALGLAACNEDAGDTEAPMQQTEPAVPPVETPPAATEPAPTEPPPPQ